MNDNFSVLWKTLGMDIKSFLVKPLHPKFVFIAISTLVLSTCGIWIPPFFLSDYTQIGSSFFTFIVATLGVLAAENYFNGDDSEKSQFEKYRCQAKSSFVIFLWLIAFILSFTGVKNEFSILLLISFIMTLLLWLIISSTKSEYDLHFTPEDNMKAQLNKNTAEPGDGLE